ncbi:hypothetical protein ACM61V_04380 [Sphingomonas sp. TX0543]|uniref:hypothetical protein n=1 Tax=unclassified Sphingomonas TaxID=196159 RepID=UPI0010F6C41D|nr:hypothetical protein [Sphingomonas sp. 3P27F8]
MEGAERMTEHGRWFTGSADGLIPLIFTELEQGTLAEIITFARDPANRDRELLHCIDGAGTALIGSSTGYRSAPVTDEMNDAATGGPVRYWHNHPSQDSISQSDWILAATRSTIEIFAVNEVGSSFAGRILSWRDGMSDVIANFADISETVERGAADAMKVARIDFADIVAFSHRTVHVVNLAMARAGLVEYSYRFMREDAALMARAEAGGFVATGIASASAEIRRVCAAEVHTPPSTSAP